MSRPCTGCGGSGVARDTTCRVCDGTGNGCDCCPPAVATVTEQAPPRRPRIAVEKDCGMAWKYEDGAFWYTLSARPDLIDWRRDDPREARHELDADRVRMWADLLANPTEEVDADA